MNEPHLDLELPDAAATEALGARLASLLAERKGLLVYLEGELGAGKTTLARGWLRALGIRGAIRSPTYTLVEPYEFGGHTLLHLDLYRLNDPAELEQLGLSDTPPDGNHWLVEWPERGGGRLPPPDLRILLTGRGPSRHVRLEANEALRPLFETLRRSGSTPWTKLELPIQSH